MTTPPQNHELSFPLGFHSNFYKNRAPTLGEKRQKSVRFDRDVLQFATFCHTSRLKLHFLTFCTRSRARTPDEQPRPPNSTKNDRIPNKTLNSPLEKNRARGTTFTHFFENSTPTLHGNAKKRASRRDLLWFSPLLRHL